MILTGKHLCRGLFFNNAAGHQLCTFIKKRLQQKFRVKSDKKQNIFLHNSFKISENFDIKHLRWSKTDLSKETKKDSKKRYCTNFRNSHQEVLYKEGVLKNFATCLFAYH